MGLVWILRTDGKRCHLPVQGDDVNTPDTAIDVSFIQAVTIDKCFGEPIVVNHPIFGQFTIDMRYPGIIGSCNQCGQCCTHPVEACPGNCAWPYRSDIDCHACPHLVVDKVNKWPQANNTYCDIYQTILDVFKGCAYPPRALHPHMTNCGYSLI